MQINYEQMCYTDTAGFRTYLFSQYLQIERIDPGTNRIVANNLVTAYIIITNKSYDTTF